ncbi:glycosyltransferase [Streptomyces sp. V3I7]|uniref:glycosyltransferase family 2 protein n=1 Tax=Streptomyces sp. V3I7 TaxID=3042278 RepID=UPI0027D844AD|nr:glycosyltransferase [Streptomyces sp. V3I7]
MAGVAYWAASARSFKDVSGLFLGVYYVLLTLAVLAYMALAAFPVRSRFRRAVKGRVLAVIPSFNETDEAVHATVHSLLNQKRRPDYIHVVDDGSQTPLRGFSHPLVTWHRQKNGGKRAAQVTALCAAVGMRQEFEYILTVDSDSELEPDALWLMLREMNKRRVMACTGIVLVRNRSESILARLADVNLFIFCYLSRGLRSAIGVVNPTSGALSLYRTPVIMDNLDHYLSGGTDGDDRQLCDYALMRGKVVSVPGAYVITDMPSTITSAYKQRRRWGKSGWRFIPWELINLDGGPLVTRVIEICTEVLLPILYIGVGVTIWRSDTWAVVPQLFATASVFLLAELLFYAALRPGLKTWERATAPLLVPLYALMMFFIVYPAKYWSITKVRQKAKEGENDWGTRGHQAGPAENAAAVSEPMHVKTFDALDESTLMIQQYRNPVSSPR